MKNYLEKYISIIPMYIMTLASLAIVIAFSVILSATGLLRYSVLEITLSTIVFTTSGLLANKLFGKLYSVNTHQLSAAITSLILIVVFRPSADIAILLQYSLISGIAQASKYILVYDSRHLFNPAAFAIFVASITQLQYANWWIGTPSLIIITAALSFCILKKTNHLYLGAWFIIISIALISYLDIQNGASLQQAFVTSLSSWPIIFIAGFMLSEPLTLPSTRSQKISIAIIVATITSWPIHLGLFDSTPAFALLIGNLAAFALSYKQRHSIHLTLIDSKKTSNSTYEYSFRPSKKLNFQAGQFIELQLPHKRADSRGLRRYFSITSMPQDKYIKLGIKYYQPSSSFKKRLQQAKIGTKMKVVNISGDFVLPKSTETKLLFIAGGIGITPFMSHIRDKSSGDRDIAVAYYNNSKEDTAYYDELNKTKHNIIFVNKAFSVEQIIELFPDYKDREVYISGPPAMVSSVKKAIVKITNKPIRTDYFTGY